MNLPIKYYIFGFYGGKTNKLYVEHFFEKCFIKSYKYLNFKVEHSNKQ